MSVPKGNSGKYLPGTGDPAGVGVGTSGQGDGTTANNPNVPSSVSPLPGARPGC